MATRKKLADEQIKFWMENDFTQAEMARLAGVSTAAISKRIANIERTSLAKAPANIERSYASIWDTKAAIEENYERAIKNFEMSEDATRAIAEIRNHQKLSIDVLAMLYSVEEVRAFQEEVLAVINECEPSLRERIIQRLQQRRSIRAAFVGGR